MTDNLGWKKNWVVIRCWLMLEATGVDELARIKDSLKNKGKTELRDTNEA